MNTETFQTVQGLCLTDCVKYLLHKGDSKYTGSCEINYMIFLTKKSLDLNHD